MNRYHVTEIDLYLCEVGDGDPEWQLSQQEQNVLNQRCLGKWTAKDEDDLRNKIVNFIGYPVETIKFTVKEIN